MASMGDSHDLGGLIYEIDFLPRRNSDRGIDQTEKCVVVCGAALSYVRLEGGPHFSILAFDRLQ